MSIFQKQRNCGVFHCYSPVIGILRPLTPRQTFHQSSPLSSQPLQPHDDDDELFAKENLFPPPSDEMIRRHGMPLLARAAHHARMGRTLAYDMYPSRNADDLDLNRKKVEYSYSDMLSMSTHIHKFFMKQKKKMPLTNDSISGNVSKSEFHQIDLSRPPPRIAFLCDPGPLYVATQFAAWSSGSIAVPLCTSHRSKELAYVLQDSDPTFVIDGMHTLSEGRDLRAAARDAGKMDRYWCLDDILSDYHKNPVDQDHKEDVQGSTYALGNGGDIISVDSPAMIIYTSGTTGNPKGVVHTHRNLYHQVTDLIQAWKWTHDDAILHFLPLHHVHGVINKLGCAVWAGGSVEFMKFHPVRLWERLAEASKKPYLAVEHSNNNSECIPRRAPTLFMAVPTIYAKMLEVIPQLPASIRPWEFMSRSPIRLMVSGSAALPTGIHNRWKAATGQTILERYGMTEMAMALSNPLEPVEGRLPGYVGMPLPSVEVKIIDEDTGELSSSSGELCVKGPTVFLEYWQNPHATAESFDADGWFKTGDVAEYDPVKKSYHILGRVSADIIKSGGHKLSSLQIERVLLEHPDLEEVVVLGIPDETYGERVGVICRLKNGDRTLDMKHLQSWCKTHMASYKIPTRMIIMKDDIPKNAMGKVSKKQLVHLFQDRS